MLHAPAQLVEQRPGPCEILGLASRHAEKLTLARGRHGAADRAFEKAPARRADLGGERGGGRGQHRAHLDHQGVRQVARQQAARAAIGRVERGVVDQHDDDGVARPGQPGRVVLPAGALRHKGCGALGRAVPHRDLVALLQQALGHGGAHLPGAADADLHFRTRCRRRMPPAGR